MALFNVGDVVFLRIRNLVGYAVVYDDSTLCLIDADIFVPIVCCDIVLNRDGYYVRNLCDNQKFRIERIREDIKNEITLVGHRGRACHAIR